MDRGLWQVSSYSWPGYTDAEIFDPVSAASIAFELSDGGTDFGLWGSYTSGTAQRHFDEPFNGWPAVQPIVAGFCG